MSFVQNIITLTILLICIRSSQQSIIGAGLGIWSNNSSCNSSLDCGPIEQVSKRWCDYTKRKCQIPESIFTFDHLCLDMVTPFGQEPTISNGKNNDTRSISKEQCESDGGQVHQNHCCPRLKKRGNETFSIPQNPYKTNIACYPNKTLPMIFSFAWCDKSTQKIWTLGLLGKNQHNIYTNFVMCSKHDDCGNGFVCINEVRGRRVCYFDPLNSESFPIGATFAFFAPLLIVLFILAATMVYIDKYW
ncbi:unnamed protein product [Caenorhabditis angaria]|uniref:Domain of unknown function DX domain-containing protein n=1 Tax=Caenorhabditis angaria TaxID=860376 RepID=A0A9P1IKY4_9PELO|nr:unnamed protein product [Caenorhabditis angaria]